MGRIARWHAHESIMIRDTRIIVLVSDAEDANPALEATRRNHGRATNVMYASP